MSARSATAVLALLAAAACQQTTITNSARLVGSHDVALVGKHLVITSADTNELRVLDTATSRFVLAPNPLETLTVPVLDRPTSLVLDEQWTNGARSAGSYVFALRPGASEVSVVWVDPADAGVGLYEVKRIPFAAPLTAAAAARVDQQVTLFVATFDGERGQLVQLALPGAPGELRAKPVTALVAATTTVASFDRAPAVELIVVPPLPQRRAGGAPFCQSQLCVAAALREASGRTGAVRLIDPGTGRSVSAAFPGPVRQLATHANGGGLPAGQHLFGLLDEAACGSSACGGMAVAVLREATDEGFPALAEPLRTGNALPMGLSVGVGAAPNGAEGGEGDEIVGVITRGDGTLLFFDGSTGAAFATLSGDERFPYVVTLDSSATDCAGAILPGETAWDTSTPSAPKLFVAYPSANAVGVLQPANTAFQNGAAGAAQLTRCHR